MLEEKIIKIEKIKFKGKVYNIEVEEDNSYCANGIIAHNCEEPVNPMSKFDFFYNPKEPIM